MQRRDAVLRAMKDHPISQRRACVLIGVDPKTVRRERPPDNPEIREEMHKIAEKRRRFGYRRVGIMLERKGMICLLYTSPSPRDATLSRMPSSA